MVLFCCAKPRLVNGMSVFCGECLGTIYLPRNLNTHSVVTFAACATSSHVLRRSSSKKPLTKLNDVSIASVYKDVSKSSRTVLVKRRLLTLDDKFLHHLQNTPLLHEYSGPSFSAMLGRIPGSSFLELCQVPAVIPLESLQWCESLTLHPLGEEEKVTGGQIG